MGKKFLFFMKSISSYRLAGICAFALFFSMCSCDEKKEKQSLESSDSEMVYSEIISEESFKRSWDIMNKGQELANNGASIEEILKILPDATLVETNESDVMFHINGSTPMIIELPVSSETINNKGGSVKLIQQRRISTAIVSGISAINKPVEDEKKPEDVVGSQRGEKARQVKKALLMSPFLAEFGNDDDYYSVKDIFNRHRNYSGNVAVRQSKLSLKDFEDWGQFDIVHVSTHGKNFCGTINIVVKGDINKADNQGKKNCRSLLSTGIKHGYLKASEAFEFINTNGYAGLVVVSTKSFHLRSTFFDHFYGKGLKNKIWYFSACEMGQLSDMTSTMSRIHKNGHFLYWTNVVGVDDASRAATTFYTSIFKNGIDANTAYEKIPRVEKTNLLSTVTILRDGDEITKKTTTDLKIINTGVLKHGIELIDLIHPEDNTIVRTGDFYPVEGNFGDGQKEAIDLRLRLYGFTRSEFEAQKFKLSLKVDDETVLNKIQFIPNTTNYEISVQNIPQHEYALAPSIKNIKIADVGEKTDLTLKAYLHFDDTYFSIHSEKVNIKSEGILAIINDGNSIAKFYYDAARDAVRVETDDQNMDTYMDAEGYFYFHNNNEGMPLGWVKSKAMASMFMGNFSFTAVEGNEHVNDDTGKFNFPIISWAQKHTTRHYSQNSNFRKQSLECDLSKPCVKFEGIAGEETGHYAVFNPGGKLIEMGQDAFKIKFEYGLYEVKLPVAAEISIPGFN